VLIEVLSDGSEPCWGDIGKVYGGVLKEVFSYTRFNLAVLETQDNEFAAFTVRENRVSEIFQLGDSYFRAKVEKGKASHSHWSMADLCLETT
jgi:hypothetical protein